MDRWKAPGMAVAIIHGNETWAKGFGYASLPSTPVTPHTLFYTGSTTKSFTAAALSLLIDDNNNSNNNSSSSSSSSGDSVSDIGTLSWTTPISRLLRDDFVLADDWATAHVTLEDALSHRTGYPRHDLAFAPSNRDQVRRLRHLPLSAEPRQRFQYCNHMFTALGYLVETLAGKEEKEGGTWLGAFFRDRLWAPMGMDETFLSRGDPRFEEGSSQKRLLLANGYYCRNRNANSSSSSSNDDMGGGGGEYVKRPWVPADWDTGAGAVISNVLDYARYLRAMMREAAPLSPAGHRALKTPWSLYDESGPPFAGSVTYALGWMHGVFEDVETWHHTGTVNEFVTSMLVMPSRAMGIVVMCNAASEAKNLVWYRIMYDLLGVEESRRFDFEEQFRREARQARERVDRGRERLYPDVPTPPLPPSAALGKHAGRYHAPGYGYYVIDLVCDDDDDGDDDDDSSSRIIPEPVDGEKKGRHNCHLEAHAEDNLMIEIVFMLEHVSGDYWVGWAHVKGLTDDPWEPLASVRAQFRLDERGVVSQAGFGLRLEEGDEAPLVWFTRVP